MIRWCILPLCFWLVVPNYDAALYAYGTDAIRPDSETVVLNILGQQNYKNHFVTNVSNIWHIIYTFFRKMFKR